MRKKITLIAAFACFLAGPCDVAFCQITQVLEIEAHLPTSALDIKVDNPALQPQNIFNPVVLSTSTTGGFPTVTYQWSPTTGLDDGTSANPTLTYDTTVTSYTVTATDANGCTSSSTVTIDFSTSLADRNSLPVSLSIFPNPNDGRFHMSLKGRPLNDPLEIRVLDVVGREIHSEDGIRFAGKLEKDLDLTALGAGIYFVNLKSGNAQTTQKLVIK